MLFLTAWLLNYAYKTPNAVHEGGLHTHTGERHCQGHAVMRDKPLSCAWLSAAVQVSFILFCLPLLRPGLESVTDRVTLSDYEARRLLNALVKEFIQMTAEELEQASEGNR